MAPVMHPKHRFTPLLDTKRATLWMCVCANPKASFFIKFHFCRSCKKEILTNQIEMRLFWLLRSHASLFAAHRCVPAERPSPHDSLPDGKNRIGQRDGYEHRHTHRHICICSALMAGLTSEQFIGWHVDIQHTFPQMFIFCTPVSYNWTAKGYFK